MDLLNIIKSIRPVDFEGYGVAVAYTDIFIESGLDRDALGFELRELKKRGKITLCVDESHDENLIIAVKLV